MILGKDEEKMLYVSSPIRELYGIIPQKPTTIVLDSNDFLIVSNNLVTTSENGLDKIQIIKIELNKNTFNSISISDLDIISPGTFPDFDDKENLPVQSTIPAFLGLILLSFPLGFVILNNAKFLKDENFSNHILCLLECMLS